MPQLYLAAAQRVLGEKVGHIREQGIAGQLQESAGFLNMKLNCRPLTGIAGVLAGYILRLQVAEGL